jgi:hypothetical protein
MSDSEIKVGKITSLDLYSISPSTYSSQTEDTGQFNRVDIGEKLRELKQKMCCNPWAIRHRLVNTETGESVGMRCNKYDCLYCGPRKVSEWRALIEMAQPQRFITLTRVGGSLADVSRVTETVVRRLRRGAKSGGRGRASEVVRNAYEFEYLAVYEPHKNSANGYHIHLLQKGDYIPQNDISEALMSATHGHSYVADVKKIKDDKVAGYVTKYMCKGLMQAEIGYKPDGTPARTRRLRYSRNFFPAQIGVMRDDLRSQWLGDDAEERVGSWVLQEVAPMPRNEYGKVDAYDLNAQYMMLVAQRAADLGDDAKQTRGGLMVLNYMLQHQAS